MPRIIAAAHAPAPYPASQEEIRHAAMRVFAERLPATDRLPSVFDHCRIAERQLMRPLDWYLVPHTAVERNRIYLEEGLALLVEAARRCLRDSRTPPDAIDHVICVSSTGHATPSLDARLINELALPRTATRLPIWGLGCAAGAAALARALDHCRAYPAARVLVTALECCSLTFLGGDLSKKNLVAAAIFGDGAAAALVAGDVAGGRGPRITASGSFLFPDSYDIMGWEFVDEGMALVLSPRLPVLVRQELPGIVNRFLRQWGVAPGDLVHYLTHPGGAKVLDAYRRALDLGEDDLAFSEEVLRNHGNISSASVLLVLEKWLASAQSQKTGFGLLSAFGPGFSAELVLLEV